VTLGARIDASLQTPVANQLRRYRSHPRNLRHGRETALGHLKRSTPRVSIDPMGAQEFVLKGAASIPYNVTKYGLIGPWQSADPRARPRPKLGFPILLQKFFCKPLIELIFIAFNTPRRR
jgi:hypothetical protein